jgi:hypothetical protein
MTLPTQKYALHQTLATLALIYQLLFHDRKLNNYGIYSFYIWLCISNISLVMSVT